MAKNKKLSEENDNTNDVVEDKKKEKNKKEKKDKKGKKEKKDKKEKKEKKPKKKKGCFITILIMAILIGVVVAIFGFNVGGIKEKLRPTLSKIPIINKMISKEPEKNVTKEAEPQKQEDIQIEELNKQVIELNKEIERLKVFENSQVKFKEEKSQFDKMIALKEPKSYSTFYEQIAPENADKLYKEAIANDKQSKKLDDYMKTFENMKKDAASKILGELMLTDIDLVISILDALPSEKRSEILSTMDSKDAATCVKLLSPK